MTEPIDARGLMTDGGVGRYLLDPAAVIGIAIHHSVSGGQFFMSSAPTQDEELSHLIMIDQYHASLGWGGFAYHLAAFPSGRLYLCGNLTGARAHVASRNNELVGLVLIGNFMDTWPPPLELDDAAAGVAYMRRTYPGRPIRPHRQWALPAYPTSCPGDTWQAWIGVLEAPPAQEDDMFESGDRDRLANVEEAIARIESAVSPLTQQAKTEQRTFVRFAGQPHVYRLTEEQTLVHAVGLDEFKVQSDDIIDLPASHKLHGLRAIYPAGVPL